MNAVEVRTQGLVQFPTSPKVERSVETYPRFFTIRTPDGLPELVLSTNVKGDLELEIRRSPLIRFIDSFPGEPYCVLTPIRITLKHNDCGDVTASFVEANIAVSGDSPDDAFGAIGAEILDVYDMYSQQQQLGPRSAQQLTLLRQYIERE